LRDTLEQLVKRADSNEISPSIVNHKYKFQESINSSGHLTYDSIITEIHKSRIIGKDGVLIPDASLSIFPVSLLPVEQNQFISCANWGMKGWSIPAAIGVHCRTEGKNRPFIFIGDGGFQIASHSFGTLARMKARAVVFLFNNGAKGLDQWSANPKVYKNQSDDKIDPFNMVPKWKYEKTMESYGGEYFPVETTEQLCDALRKIERMDNLVLIDMKLKLKDIPELTRWRVKETKE